MSLKIDYEELEMAMSSHDLLGLGRYYLDRQTGEVFLVSDWVLGEAQQHDDPADITDDSIRLAWYQLWYDGEVGEELPEVEERAMAQQVDAYLARFLEVPHMGSHDAYQDMVDFADTVANPHLRDLLYVALDDRGAFRRFKDVLWRYDDEQERWFAFSSQRWRERIDDWLRDEGVLPAGGND